MTLKLEDHALVCCDVIIDGSATLSLWRGRLLFSTSRDGGRSSLRSSVSGQKGRGSQFWSWIVIFVHIVFIPYRRKEDRIPLFHLPSTQLICSGLKYFWNGCQKKSKYFEYYYEQHTKKNQVSTPLYTPKKITRYDLYLLSLGWRTERDIILQEGVFYVVWSLENHFDFFWSGIQLFSDIHRNEIIDFGKSNIMMKTNSRFIFLLYPRI